MPTAQLKARKETSPQERPERENDSTQNRDYFRDQVVGIVTLVIMLALFILAIVLASIYGEPADLDHIDYWMMP